MQRHETHQEHMSQGPERNSVWLEARGTASRENHLKKTWEREALILVNNVILIHSCVNI